MNFSKIYIFFFTWLKSYVIFNIGGNNYRMITKIDFNGNLVIVKIMMTHAEYSKDKWKEIL
jgi:mRNA interferase HigB